MTSASTRDDTITRPDDDPAVASAMRLLRSALDDEEGGVWSMQLPHGRTARSPALLRRLLLDPELVNSVPDAWAARIHPDDQSRVHAAVDTLCRGEAPSLSLEYRVAAGDGSWHTIAERGRKVTPRGALGITADITHRRRVEDALRELSSLAAMGQLAARVAHEVNNPLAGIQNAFLLLRGAITDDHPHYRFVGAIEREIARIAAVTRQLYETYRPETQQERHASVILAVGDAVAFLEQVNHARDVQILTDTRSAPSRVPIPDALLRQTLYNLVQNAIDASPVGGTVTVVVSAVGAHCEIRVADEGPGVPDALREQIFAPFFSTKARTSRTGGMGIGLAMVRQSVTAVGGTISLEARAARGAEFIVRLPMTPLDTGVWP
jgi:signal transduction histidine kinase